MSRLALLPVSLPFASIPDGTDVEVLSKQFSAVLTQPIPPGAFLPDAVWRDNLALTGSLRTFYGAEAVSMSWNETNSALKTQSFTYLPRFTREWKLPGGSSWLDLYFEFETATEPRLLCTVGLSVAYIVPDGSSEPGSWKIWVIKSVLDQLKSAPNVDMLPPPETENGANPTPLYDSDIQTVDCVIVGAGQAGLNTAARCEALGINYLVIDQNKSIGDNWRMRYKSTKLHTIREYAHLPFDRTFGEEYPEFLTKDNLADGYAKWTAKYGIKIRFETTLKSGTWDEKTERWTLNIETIQNGETSKQTLSCAFVVMCVGAGGQVPVLPQLPGRDIFQGQAIHSAEYLSPEAWAGKNGVVIGSANTAHDVAEDMVAAGLASTTMVQRNPTFVLPVEWYTASQSKIYTANIPTAVADKLSFIGPHAVQRIVSQTIIHDLVRNNWDRFEALEKAGFKLDAFGDPHWHLIERLGGHYMDVGASAKISEGLIKVKSGAALTHYTTTGLGFSDGTELPADLVVFATGFDLNIQSRIREFFGDVVADKVGPFSYMNDEGELEGAWKFNHPGLACNGGAIGPSRWYSRFIGLHMKAKLMGTPLIVYGGDS